MLLEIDIWYSQHTVAWHNIDRSILYRENFKKNYAKVTENIVPEPLFTKFSGL